ncbi:Rhamnogalacturonyl hydrolase YesR [Dysgonomonas macrotermitis]|uniref:Rhamnogalacturonyl hydrolase YesR n=1 Tax=Dysgonomonas macrotermitis TaxID=1346286 RepID=A0A1M4TM39_9BACT|nr:Rhamnogalacturonyl hydrolase YesR [Dysgonomonas macrotermitis]
MTKTYKHVLLAFFLIASNFCVFGQKEQNKVNDFNTPLHLLPPDYKTPYGEVSTSNIKQSLDRILKYLEGATPARVINKDTHKEITDLSKIDKDSELDRGSFRLASYEWGVTYSGMLEVAAATGDSSYYHYVKDRFELLANAAPQFKRIMNDYGVIDPQMKQLLTPHALDDAGAMCAAMIRLQQSSKLNFDLRSIIDNYMNYIMYKEYRLYDGTFARKRPQMNTLWLDDMYMSIPAIAQMGKLTGEGKYYNEAVKQIKQFTERMFVKEKGLYMHGWVESMDDHPAFFWGRANGWAILTMTDVLDVLPQNHPERQVVLEQLRKHIKGITSYQSGEGFWHQLLDRNDSYLETSATAIYVYCIAHAINKGWIDPVAYGPVAQLGWNAVSSKVNSMGQVEGTCVGTGMAFDPSFYYHRPVNVYAAHGYGPVLLAGAEMIKLLNKFYPKMNDSAIQYYTTPQNTTAPIFGVEDSTRPDAIVSGSSRKNEKAPVVFLIGDSTVKNGRGDGSGGQWGWGSFFDSFFDTSRISVENHALGGRSSRTFFTEGLWNKVLPGLKKGDYVLMQFGHNDGGPLNTGRARASLKGTGEESETVIMESNGGPEEVFTYGHYLRLYIRQAKAVGAIPIVLSPTPGNRWTDGKANRMTNTYTQWAQEVARQEGVEFIDLNAISAEKLDAMGETAGRNLFKDSVHTTEEGAKINGQSVVDGLKKIPDFSLNQYLKK